MTLCVRRIRCSSDFSRSAPSRVPGSDMSPGCGGSDDRREHRPEGEKDTDDSLQHGENQKETKTRHKAQSKAPVVSQFIETNISSKTKQLRRSESYFNRDSMHKYAQTKTQQTKDISFF